MSKGDNYLPSSGDTRAYQVARSPPSNVPWSSTPPGTSPSCALAHGGVAALRTAHALGTREEVSFEAVPHGPPARAPTHRRLHRCRRRKAHYRPAWLWLWSDGIRTRWVTNCISRVPLLLSCKRTFPGRTNPATPRPRRTGCRGPTGRFRGA